MSEFDVLKALSESGGEMEWSALMNTDKSCRRRPVHCNCYCTAGISLGRLPRIRQ